jgi:hypothetical protein
MINIRIGRGGRSRRRAAGPISARAGTGQSGRGILLLMGVIFTLVGAGTTFFILFLPLWRVVEARSWTPTPAVVESSRVRSHSGSDSTTYSIDITYRYEVDGTSYTADRYHFMVGSSSGRAGKQRVVDAHPRGTNITVYVDPKNPTRAIIHRGLTPDMLFGLIPLAFLLAGIAMLVGGLKMRPRKAISDAAAAPSASGTPPSGDLVGALRAAAGLPVAGAGAGDGPVTLQSGSNRTTKLVGLALFAVFWNGVSWAMFIFLLREREWIGVAFLSIFVLIGLAVIGGLIHAALAMFNPRVILRLSRGNGAPGQSIRIDWELQGPASRIRSFRIVLEGVEEATYRRGTRTSTDRHLFHEQDVLHLTDSAAIMTARGQATLVVPADKHPTWSASRNKIVWRLRVRGDIPRWPDVNDEFDFTILPAPIGQAVAGGVPA